jgi:hypothetical protein
MIVSQARIDANRCNAQKSTGPRTIDGKCVSRANGLIHGLCASIVVPEDAELVHTRAVEIFKAFKPYTDYQVWNVDRAAILTIRIEGAERMERRVRDKICLRAALTWDDDRRLEAEVLGGVLPKKPAETIEMLRRTPHGCEWLMARWALLAHAADNNPKNLWTGEQTAMAFDLLATPSAFRVGRKPGTSIDFQGIVLDAADDSAAVARRMVDELMERREVVRGLDEVDRALAEADLDHDTSSELRRLRRYESALHNRLRWTIKQLTFQGPPGTPDPALSPVWKVESAPIEKPEPKHPEEKAAEAHDPTSFSPPFCLTPDEFPPPGQKADVAAIVISRKKKRVAKDKARREANRRKAKNLRA